VQRRIKNYVSFNQSTSIRYIILHANKTSEVSRATYRLMTIP
jgi:hypothetical protein